MSIDDGFKALAASVFLLTERDLRKAKKMLERYPNDSAAKGALEEIGDFLWSDWAGVLEATAGVEVIEKMKEVLK